MGCCRDWVRRLASSAALGVVGCAAVMLLAATTAAAAECPNEGLRNEQHARQLSACRAYELVSPPFKAGFEFRVVGLASNGASGFAQSLAAIKNA